MKALKHTIIYSFTLICILACNSHPKIKNGGYPVNKHKAFIFSSDSTFVYQEFFDRYSTGEWSLSNNNTLKINSKKQDRQALLKAEVVPTSNEYTKITLNLNINGLNPENYVYRTVINDKVSDLCSILRTNSFYIKHKIDSISFLLEKRPLQIEALGLRQPDYYPVKTNTVFLKYTLGDEITLHLTLTDSLFSYRIFTDEILKIRNNEVIFHDKEKKVKKKFPFILE